MTEKYTHFGFEKVREEEKESRVEEVFTDVASKYDIMNDAMSFGLHRIWKRIAVFLSSVKEGDKVLDLASGTGDIAKLLAQKVGKTGSITLSDINLSMLRGGRDALIDSNLDNKANYIQANAESLPFADNYYDLVTMGFGLRNVTNKDNALKSINRVLKPGGKVLILEFSKPNALLKPFYDFYSFNLIPKMGEFLTGKPEHYKYLVESIRMHPDQEGLKKMMIDAGFENCSYHNLCGGVVAVHIGYRV